MHVLVLINLLKCLIFKFLKFQQPHLEHDAEDEDINDIVQGGIYDYLRNVSTWVIIESCSNYLNLLLYTPL